MDVRFEVTGKFKNSDNLLAMVRWEFIFTKEGENNTSIGETILSTPLPLTADADTIRDAVMLTHGDDWWNEVASSNAQELDHKIATHAFTEVSL
jgi:hypothetical protein